MIELLSELLGEMTQFAYIIVTLQFIVAVLATVALLRARRALKKDNDDLSVAQQVVNDIPEPWDDHGIEQARRGLPEHLHSGGLLRQRVQIAARYLSVGRKVDTGPFTVAAVEQSDNRMRAFKLLTGSLVLLGLLGTVYGLMVTVYELRPLFTLQDFASGSNWEHAFASLSEAFGGMRAAFITTLIGISGTLLLNFFLGLPYQNAEAKWRHGLEQFTYEEIIPLYTPELTHRAIERAAHKLDQMAGTVQQTIVQLALQTETIAGEMNNFVSFISVFDDASRKIRSSVVELKGQHERLIDSVTTMKGSAVSLGQSVQLSKVLTQEYHDKIDQYHDKTVAMSEGVETLIGNLRQNQVDFKNVVMGYVDTLDKLTKKAGESDQQLDVRMNALLNSLNNARLNIRTDLDDITDQLTNTISEDREDAKAAMSSFSRELLDRVDSQMEQLSSLYSAILQLMETSIGKKVEVNGDAE